MPEDRRFVGFDAYQKALIAGPDLVILATPPGFRPIHFEAAVEAGKHVFMEKPVATDAPGVRRVLAAAEEAKKKNLAVGVGLQRHHEAMYLETIKRLQDGAIGDIVAMRVYWNGSTPWVKRAELTALRPQVSEMEYQMRNWYYFTWLCGDHIVEQHIHNLDVINWLKDGYPVQANGMGGCQVRKGQDYGEIFDHHAVEFEYADGSRMFSQCRHIPNCWNSVSEHAHGTKGTADISTARSRPAGGEPLALSRPHAQPLPGRARRSVRQHPLRQSDQRGRSRRQEHDDRHPGPHVHLLGQGDHLGRGDQVEDQPGARRLFVCSDAQIAAGPDGLYQLPVPGLSKVV